MERPLRVTLTDQDITLARFVARSFGDVKAPGQSEQSRLAAESQYDIDYRSACGRIGFIERFLGLQIDRTPRRGGDRGYHVMLPTGSTLDVKTTSGGPLVIGGDKPGMNLRTDYIGLAEVPKGGDWDGRTVKLIGYTTAVEFMRLAKTRDFGHGMRRYVDRGALNRDLASFRTLVTGVEHHLAPETPPPQYTHKSYPCRYCRRELSNVNQSGECGGIVSQIHLGVTINGVKCVYFDPDWNPASTHQQAKQEIKDRKANMKRRGR